MFFLTFLKSYLLLTICRKLCWRAEWGLGWSNAFLSTFKPCREEFLLGFGILCLSQSARKCLLVLFLLLNAARSWQLLFTEWHFYFDVIMEWTNVGLMAFFYLFIFGSNSRKPLKKASLYSYYIITRNIMYWNKSTVRYRFFFTPLMTGKRCKRAQTLFSTYHVYVLCIILACFKRVTANFCYLSTSKVEHNAIVVDWCALDFRMNFPLCYQCNRREQQWH